MAQFLVLPSPVGELAVRMEQSALTGLFLRHQRYAPALPWDTLPQEQRLGSKNILPGDACR